MSYAYACPSRTSLELNSGEIQDRVPLPDLPSSLYSVTSSGEYSEPMCESIYFSGGDKFSPGIRLLKDWTGVSDMYFIPYPHFKPDVHLQGATAYVSQTIRPLRAHMLVRKCLTSFQSPSPLSSHILGQTSGISSSLCLFLPDCPLIQISLKGTIKQPTFSTHLKRTPAGWLPSQSQTLGIL